jgi:hypothetical protein
VIRFNKGILGLPQVREGAGAEAGDKSSRIGKKITILAGNALEKYSWLRCGMPEVWFVKTQRVEEVAEWLTRRDGRYQRIFTMENHLVHVPGVLRPSSGAIVVYNLVTMMEPRRVTLYGFDHFATETWTWDLSHRIRRRSPHSTCEEMALFSGLGFVGGMWLRPPARSTGKVLKKENEE